jgi:hypothetical protein
MGMWVRWIAGEREKVGLQIIFMLPYPFTSKVAGKAGFGSWHVAFAGSTAAGKIF